MGKALADAGGMLIATARRSARSIQEIVYDYANGY